MYTILNMDGSCAFLNGLLIVKSGCYFFKSGYQLYIHICLIFKKEKLIPELYSFLIMESVYSHYIPETTT